MQYTMTETESFKSVRGDTKMEENMVVNEVITETPQEAAPDNAGCIKELKKAAKNGWIKELKKAATKIGWKYFVFGLAVIIAQNVYALLLPEKYYTESWANFLMIIVAIIAVGMLLSVVIKAVRNRDSS